MTVTDDALLVWRKHFPILSRTTYMISHSLGAMPDRTHDRMREYTDAWAERGIRAWEEGWWEMPMTVGNLIARAPGAHAASVGVHVLSKQRDLFHTLVGEVCDFGQHIVEGA